MSPTRRSVLAAMAAASLAGCRPRRTLRRAVPVADLAVVDQALHGERALLDRYDAAIARLDAVAAGPLSRARDRHAAHLRALTQARTRPSPTESPPSAAPSAGTSDQTPLGTVLAASAAALRTAAVQVRSGRVAGLLSSVAAEHGADASAGGPTS